jgi:hypothetical protein
MVMADTTGEMQSDTDWFPRDLANFDTAGAWTRAVEFTACEFHLGGDLYVLQRRCEVLSRQFSRRECGRQTLDWVATQAELIDCGLIAATRDSLELTLLDLARGAASSS